MSDPGYARLVRLMEIVDRVVKHDILRDPQMFTNEELDQILEDAKAVFSNELYALTAALVRQAREARHAMP